MFFCETCREKKNWPSGLVHQERCEVCGKNQICYNVPAVMLVPEAERSVEQKKIFKMVSDAFQDKADLIIVTDLDGRMNHRMTSEVRKVFGYRNNEVDWYATYLMRLTVQERYQQSERAKRDRR